MALSASEVDMELKASNLDQSLQRIFEELANSSFVALDLEFSGISTKQSSQQKRAPSDKGTHKQSLQQRYEEVRDAANKYQVLQIGMTVVTENRFPGGSEPTTYDLRPYNMYLSPLIRERIDLERDFAFQSEAISFLMGEGFSMDGPFRDGVNYLSRSEENVARENEERKANKDNIADINLKSHEVGLLQFVADTRHKIRAWDSKQRSDDARLEIRPGGYQVAPDAIQGFNGLQRRLVHQLVRAEFPHLTSTTRQNAMIITTYRAEYEDRKRSQRQAEFNDKLQRQKGVRWLVEAMTRGDLLKLNPLQSMRMQDGKPVFMDVPALTKKHNELQERLKNKRTVLVGHNVFVDLVYFYKTFFGRLPDQVEEFARKIHELFPLVVDTKYLATSSGSMVAGSSLADQDDLHAGQHVPIIGINPLHTKYNTSRPSHEAGYDSLVTARVLIRQAARLYSLDSWTSSDEEQFFTPPDNLSVLAPRPAYYLKADPILNHSGPPLGTQTLPLRQTSNAPQPKSKFATVNSYDLLGNSGTPSSSSDESRSRTAPVPVPLRSQQHVEQNILDFMPADQGVASTVEMVDGICAYIPDWNNEFWNIFGNKLRVNGTEEGVLELM